MSNRLSLVMEQTLPYIWHRYNLLPLPRDLLMDEKLEVLRKAVYVQTYIAAEWHGYVTNHYRRMTLNQKTFARYCVFALYWEQEVVSDPVELFLRLLGLAAFFGVYCASKGKTRALDLVPHILKRFFQHEMSDVQADSAFWTDLYNLIVDRNFLEKYLGIEVKHVDGARYSKILRAVTEEIPPLVVNRNRQLSRVTAPYVECHDPTEELVRQLSRPLVHKAEPLDLGPEPKLTLAEKREGLLRCREVLEEALAGLREVERLVTEAFGNLEEKYALRKRILEAGLQM